VAKRKGHFWRVGDVLSLFQLMGCEIADLPHPIQSEGGEFIRVRYLLYPETGRFVPIEDLEDDEQIAAEEVEYWERRLGLEVPKGDKNS
jgi:hypothetical protein